MIAVVNPAYARIIGASEADRRDLFATAARRIGTTEQYVEKDFWVCWTLHALFHRLPRGEPRLLFKGGTSVSKAFGLINRFSEDIDITVFRDDLGQAAPLEALEGLSGKQRRARLDAIREACRRYIREDLRAQLEVVVARSMEAAGVRREATTILLDSDDPDGQTILVGYPSVVVTAGPYVRPSVRIESGAKSALDPHVAAEIEPYVAVETSLPELRVRNVTTIVILHGLRRWFENKNELRQEGQRISRHYYDVHCLLRADIGPAALADIRAMFSPGVFEGWNRFYQRFPDSPGYVAASAVGFNTDWTKAIVLLCSLLSVPRRPVAYRRLQKIYRFTRATRVPGVDTCPMMS